MVGDGGYAEVRTATGELSWTHSSEGTAWEVIGPQEPNGFACAGSFAWAWSDPSGMSIGVYDGEHPWVFAHWDPELERLAGGQLIAGGHRASGEAERPHVQMFGADGEQLSNWTAAVDSWLSDLSATPDGGLVVAGPERLWVLDAQLGEMRVRGMAVTGNRSST